LSDKRVWLAVGIFVLLAGMYALVIMYGDARYKEGRTEERAVWFEVVQKAQQRTLAAEQELVAVRNERDIARSERDRLRSRVVTQAQTEIANAIDTESRIAAYRELRSSLRDTTAANHARARADYLSTVAVEP